ncbi:MAG: preQ(1) synthase [Gammaproteobacteria bacterium]|nr:preQ(1) synthase [Gammaproteobacteria bacterium]
MALKPGRELDTFANPKPERDFLISIRLPEFTCLCPLTGQPDFADMKLEYIPDQTCLELKALKLYIWSYRDEAAFHEAVTNAILDDVVAACAPRYARMTAAFNVRGGTYPTIITEYRQTGWTPAADSVLPVP